MNNFSDLPHVHRSALVYAYQYAIDNATEDDLDDFASLCWLLDVNPNEAAETASRLLSLL